MPTFIRPLLLILAVVFAIGAAALMVLNVGESFIWGRSLVDYALLLAIAWGVLTFDHHAMRSRRGR